MARQTLTDRKVQSIKAAPKGKRSQTMDGLVPGFGVRVTDTGANTYIFQTRFPGSVNQARREIAKVGGISLEAARDMARGWAALITQGIDPAHVKPGMQRVYDAHAYLDEKREALELWAAVLRQIVEPPPASNVVPIRAVATA
jgi:Arm DNA-binding domain